MRGTESIAGLGTVAFIGIGKMGLPMAKRLVGHVGALRCFDIVASTMDSLAAAGAKICRSAAEAADGAGMVITMLPDGKYVREAVLGTDGIAATMPAGGLLIDMSSSAPFDTKRLGDDLRQHGIALIDAPVSGGVARAETGKLTVMTGGEAEHVERARPLLSLLGNSVIHTGGLGSGHALKALNNYVSAAGLAAACEALVIAEAYGISPETVIDVLNASTGRNNSTEVKFKPHILSGSFASGFAMALMSKDLRTAAGLARDLHCRAGGLEEQVQLWDNALQRLGSSADHTEIYRYLKQEASGGN